jgi:tetratricopeptide (TPR) repeat protein
MTLSSLTSLRQRLRDLGAKPCHEDRVLQAWSRVLSVDTRYRKAEDFLPLKVRAALPAILAELDALAQVEEARQRWDSARSLLERLLSSLGESPEAAARRASCCDRLGSIAERQDRAREAIELYRRALSLGLAPREAERVWSRLVELHLDCGDPAGAAQAAESWADSQSDAGRRAALSRRSMQSPTCVSGPSRASARTSSLTARWLTAWRS